ncbi:hypothetical protein ACTVM3_14605 [Serratia nematodiphila]|uniref:hypothetical protein n=1 Tax=Serratia marcescens TaxID=615 RepID=UPI00387A7480|nr:hypothetical protein [Serratia marcescens]HBK4673054.1 hypothetical protein [Serratia marcescens]
MAVHSIKGKILFIASGAINLGGLIIRDLTAQDAKAIAIHYNDASSETDAYAVAYHKITAAHAPFSKTDNY